MHGKQAKLPQNLKWSVNIARLENGIYEEIVAHLEKELELNALTRELPQWPQHLASHKTCYLMALIPYCKAGESFWNSGCSNLKKLRETDAKDGRKHQVPFTQKVQLAANQINQRKRSRCSSSTQMD